jgi:hypothetical protein
VHHTPPPPKKQSSRPRITSAVQENRLHHYLTAHPFKTAKELKNELAGWSHVSVRSIQDICKKRLQMPLRCAAKKLLLMEKMVRKRMTFCKKHRAWSKKDWEDIMFSDESTFWLVNPRSQEVGGRWQ